MTLSKPACLKAQYHPSPENKPPFLNLFKNLYYMVVRTQIFEEKYNVYIKHAGY